MKTQNKLFTTSIAIILTLILSPFEIQARDYRMSGLDITIHLHADGSMHVQEDREFTFDGRFSEVYRTFPLNERATYEDFSVFEGDEPYVQNSSKEPGTFRIVEKSGHKELQLFFDARNTTRTFSIRYTVHGAINRYEDAALLYYQLISDEWTKPIYNINARIIPPEALPQGAPAHWVHGSLNAVSKIKENGIVEIRLEGLPAKTFLEIRALYPQDQFRLMSLQEGYISNSVRQEAEKLVEDANLDRLKKIDRELRMEERFSKGRTIAFILSLILISGWFWLYRNYGQRPSVSKEKNASSKMPDKDRPALVNYLVNYTYITGNALVSTMFHLAYKGFFKIEEQTRTQNILGFKAEKTDSVFSLNRNYWNENKNNLLPYENMLLAFLFDELKGRVDQIGLRTIKKQQTKMQKFSVKWKKAVKEEAKKKNWFDTESRKGRNIGLISGIIAMVAMLGMMIAFGPWLLLPFLLSVAFIIASFFILHRTKEGEVTYRQWKSLKKHLKKYHFDTKMKDLDAETVNEYLIYGLALDLSSTYFKKLTRALETHGHTTYIGWIVLYNTSLGDFGKTINKVITTTSTTMSSAAGMGGGGTMGGGGGVSSGGGGAR